MLKPDWCTEICDNTFSQLSPAHFKPERKARKTQNKRRLSHMNNQSWLTTSFFSAFKANTTYFPPYTTIASNIFKICYVMNKCVKQQFTTIKSIQIKQINSLKASTIGLVPFPSCEKWTEKPERLHIFNLFTFGAPWWLWVVPNWCFH